MTEVLSSVLVLLAALVPALVAQLLPRKDYRLKLISELTQEHQRWEAEPADTYAGELRKQLAHRIYYHLVTLEHPFTLAIISLSFGVVYPLATFAMSITFAEFATSTWILVALGTLANLLVAWRSFRKTKSARAEFRTRFRIAH